jgi:hypothetical protein
VVHPVIYANHVRGPLDTVWKFMVSTSYANLFCGLIQMPDASLFQHFRVLGAPPRIVEDMSGRALLYWLG